MALDFPDSPTNGQYYEGFVYDSTAGAWRIKETPAQGYAAVGATTGSPATGTATISDITYSYYIFAGNGTITFSNSGVADILCVGGGGGGSTQNNGVSNSAGGGGGGGGVFLRTSAPITANTYTVTVGSGSPGLSYTSAAQGENSSITHSLTDSFGALGGGGGARGSSQGGNGGSAGGSGSEQGSVGSGLDGQGAAGGAGTGTDGGGGGGGASEAGGTSADSGGGNIGGPGGDGRDVQSFITAALATSASVGEVSGSSVYFAGGGGGGGVSVDNAAGGLGGGGLGRTGGTVGGDGTANTGGGGGGAELYTSSGGDGGSGVVIVRVVE